MQVCYTHYMKLLIEGMNLYTFDKGEFEKEYNSLLEFLAFAQEECCSREEIVENIETINEILTMIEKAESELELVQIDYEADQDPGNHARLVHEYGSQEQVVANIENLKKNQRRFIELRKELTELISTSKNFDKTICFSNIRELLKQNPKVKIGQIEKDAGIRLGYMSRLEKEGNTSEPSMEFVVTAAKLLDVSLDTLISINLSGLTPHEKYLVKFFDKLKADTIADKLDWKTERPDYLKDIFVFQGETEHPLFTPIDKSYAEGSRCVFSSKSFGDNTFIRDDCYNLRLKNGTTLYLMNIEKDEHKSNDPDAYAIEAWIWVPYKSVSVLFTSRDASPIAHILDDLYKSVKSQMNHPKINKDAMYAIEAFMKDDLEDDKPGDGDDIPF